MLEPSRVLAVVLTYAAPDALDRCVAAIAAQTHPPDSILVIDNASPDPVHPAANGIKVEVVRLETNTGPAGGHAEGLAWFLQSDYSIAWVMDDDCVPSPPCLDALLTRHREADGEAIVLPWWIDVVTGEGKFYPAWCGFVVSKAVVETVGLPRRDLVWWTEDTEYVRWRMQQHGIGIERERDAVVEHQRIRNTTSRPVWKVYYEVRNTLYFRLYVQKGHTSIRLRKMFGSLGRLLVQVVMDEDRKLAKLSAYGHGAVDGFRKRLGLRVPLEN